MLIKEDVFAPNTALARSVSVFVFTYSGSADMSNDDAIVFLF